LRDKVLILPDTLALSPADARAIAGFAARGGLVVADRQPGLYDAHSRRLPRPAVAPEIVRLVAPDDRTALSALLEHARIAPVVRAIAPGGDVEVHVFRAGNGEIIGLQRAKPGDSAETVEVTLPRTMLVTDLRSHRVMGHVQHLSITLDPIEPTVLRAN
jgi:hypothetical protein